MPAYAPALPGSFAGGNARTPSVAPGSYVAPSAAPASVPPTHPQIPGAYPQGAYPPNTYGNPPSSGYPGSSAPAPSGAQRPYGAASQAPATKSKRGLVIGVGAVVVIGVVVVIAVAASGGKSRDEVASRDEAAAVPQQQRASCKSAVSVTFVNARGVMRTAGMGDAVIARIEKRMFAHCTDDSWPDDALECLVASKADPETKKCMNLLSASQQDKLNDDIKALIAQEQAAAPPIAPPAPPPAEPPPAEPAAPEPIDAAAQDPADPELPAICDEYGKQIDKLQRCRKLTSTNRKRMKDGFRLLVKGWRDLPTKSPVIRESFEKTCKLGVEAILDLRKTCR